MGLSKCHQSTLKNMSTSITIIGAGAFGTSLAISLAGKCKVNLLARDGVKARSLGGFREHVKLPSVQLPKNISVSALSDIHKFKNDIIIFALPAQNLHEVCSDFKSSIEGKNLISASKGISIESGEATHQILEKYSDKVGILSGPGFATEIARGLPTALTLAYPNIQDARATRELLVFSNIRVYTSDDVIGVALGGSLKNVIAIGCGAVMGAGLGESARASLITRGFKELSKYAVERGAKTSTLTGLSGFGDLTLTCSSPTSRNFAYGYSLATQSPMENEQTIEGLHTTKAIIETADYVTNSLPITQAVYQLITKEKSVHDCLDELFTRPYSDE